MESLLIHLQAWVQSETSAQRQLVEALDGMSAAVTSGDNEALLLASKELEARLDEGVGRDVRRRDLMARFGKLLEVPADSLSLTSLIERGTERGLAVQPLPSLRDDLREVAEDARNRARRLMVLARHHSHVLEDLLRILGANGGGNAPGEAGVLVDAKG